jgi:hypothetical protein
MAREKKTLISLENSEANFGDFLKFPCKLDELANSLLLYDKLCILTTNYLELGNIIPWMGEEILCSLLEAGTIEFALVPYDVAFTQTRNLITFYVNHSSLSIPEADINNFQDRVEIVKASVGQYPYFTDFFTVSDRVARLIALNTITSDDYFFIKFPKNLKIIMREIIENIPAYKMSTILGHEFDLKECTKFRDDGKLEVIAPDSIYAKTYLRDDLFKIMKAVRELFISGYFYMNLVNASSFMNLFFGYLMFKHIIQEKNDVLSVITDYSDLTLIGRGVYDETITGLNVLHIRETKQGKRYRSWLSNLENLPQKGMQHLAEYSELISAEIPPESRLKTSLKIIENRGVSDALSKQYEEEESHKNTSIFNDWYFKDKWNPHLFIRGEYQTSLSQSLHINLKEPADLLFLISRGCQVDYLKVNSDYSCSIKLRAFDENKIFELEYPGTPEFISYLTKSLPRIIEKSRSQDFYFSCGRCKTDNSINFTIMLISDIKCSRCGKSLFEGVLC